VIQVDGLNGSFEIRVVADEYVDPQFGTGAVKITPAHDFNDWDVAQRHNLPAVRVINHDGTMNHLAGDFAGMPVAEARKAVVQALKEKGLLTRVDKDYKNRVGVCYKCGAVIEPMLLDQWFVDMKKLAEPAIKALKEKHIAFYPESKREQTIAYLESVRDWNISRQIAWGIPIPAFQNVNDSDEWIFDENVSQEIIERDGKTYRRDPDVFDTWFSSGQWPFVCTNYPDSDDFKRYYPNSLMETGVDILYQWVARMICLGVYVTGDVPFKDVYLHGMVRSEDGRKMSKSIGNVVDPVPLLEQYGSDAVRVGMIGGRSAGESAAFAPARLVAGRNFCNKLWNIARFVEQTVGEEQVHPSADPKTAADHWLLSKLQQSIKTTASHLDNYRFSEAYETVYHFIWDDLADWYIEASKQVKNPEFLTYILGESLKLAHPFVPFVTETIWQTLTWTGDSLLVSQKWPKVGSFDKKLAQEFEEIITIVAETRAIKTAMKLTKTTLYYSDVPFLAQHAELIARLARLQGVHEVEDGNGLHLTQTPHKAWLDVDRQTIDRYRMQLKKQLEEAENTRKGLENRLANEAYLKKAPKKLVDETKASLKATNELAEKIQHELNRFA
jgi:valyl-tRNA synthetase